MYRYVLYLHEEEVKVLKDILDAAHKENVMRLKNPDLKSDDSFLITGGLNAKLQGLKATFIG